MENRKEGNGSRRQAEASKTLDRLLQHGRKAHYRFPNGSVRTYLWMHQRDVRVPMMVEQVRLYAGPGWTSSSRGMGASDLIHSIAGFDSIIGLAKKHNFPRSKEEMIPPREFNEAIDRGDNPPIEVYRSGNVAALLWSNPTFRGDNVYKVELICVFREFGPERFFPLGETANAKQCITLADKHVRQAQMRSSW